MLKQWYRCIPSKNQSKTKYEYSALGISINTDTSIGASLVEIKAKKSRVQVKYSTPVLLSVSVLPLFVMIVSMPTVSVKTKSTNGASLNPTLSRPAAVPVLQQRQGGGADEPEQPGGLPGRAGQAVPLLRLLDERLRRSGAAQDGLLAGRLQLLRPVSVAC